MFDSELKAEVEKLRAAQMSSQGIEPDRVRLFLQEITALKTMLCQQEREMVEANRSALLQSSCIYLFDSFDLTHPTIIIFLFKGIMKKALF